MSWSLYIAKYTARLEDIYAHREDLIPQIEQIGIHTSDTTRDSTTNWTVVRELCLLRSQSRVCWKARSMSQ